MNISLLRRRAGLLGAFVLLTQLTLIGACGNRAPQQTALPADAVIVAFGDSLTFGTGADAHTNYPTVLQTLSGHRVVNAGVPGEISGEGLARLRMVLEETKPGLLILCHGGNDLLRKLDMSELKKNLHAMILLASEREIPVVLVGVPEPKLALATARVYAELADETGVLYEGEVLTEVLQWPSTKHDMIHPNAAGYRKIAEALHGTLLQAGLIQSPP